MSLLGHHLRRLLSKGRSELRSILGHLTESVAFADTEVEVVRELTSDTVLVLAPHPDDEIIGLGGTLVGLLRAGGRATVVYLTDGGGPQGDRSLTDIRRREAEDVGSHLGFDQVFWDHPDTRLDPRRAEPDLVALLDELRPDAVYTPSYFEHHVDHYAANVLLARALGTSRLQTRVLGYEVWDPLKVCNVVVDVTPWLDAKLQAMGQYRTPMAYTDFAELCRHRAALHYLLHVDSARRTPEGAAETFLRQDRNEFLRAFAAWHEALIEAGSTLAAPFGALGHGA